MLGTRAWCPRPPAPLLPFEAVSEDVDVVRERGGPIEPGVNAKGAESESERDLVVIVAGLAGGIADADADGVDDDVDVVVIAATVGPAGAWEVDAVDAAGVAVAFAAPALTIRLTVSPCLMPSYSLSSLSSAIAFPLNIQRWLAGSGAPWSLNCEYSWVFRSAMDAVTLQSSDSDSTGLLDLTVKLMVLLLLDELLPDVVAGGSTRGIWENIAGIRIIIIIVSINPIVPPRPCSLCSRARRRSS